MRPGRYSTVTSAQREELWRRYKAGEAVLWISRELGQRPTNLYRVLQAAGGIEPPPRTRSPRVLTLGEREEISRGIAAGASFRSIARKLNRAVSTVSQEVARHGGHRRYRAAEADGAAWESARRPKRCLLAKSRQLQRVVAAKLKQDWSPQQIAGWLRDQYPGKPEMWVSHETIYRSLFVQARGALKKELMGHLRSRRSFRRPRHATDGRRGERIANAVSIRQRPAEVEDRAVPGHWEGDLVEGSRGTFIATLVERRSRFVIENTNGLLRQYYPKGTDLSAVSQAHLDIVARKLNTRPRMTLDWKTPAVVFETSVSTTH